MSELSATERDSTDSMGLPVSGMTCSACATRLQKALARAPGIHSAAVNFATERADVVFDPGTVNAASIADAVVKAGFEVRDSRMSTTRLTIGQLAKLGNVTTSLLRYYEREGLLEPVGRTQSGYRHYSTDSLNHLRFIRRAQRYGFSLSDIKLILGAAHEADAVNDIKAIAEQRFIDIERRVTKMLVLRRELEIFLDDLADLIGEQAAEEVGSQYRDLMVQVCGHEHGGTSHSSLQKLTERMSCNLAKNEWDKLLTDLRGCHMHIWQEDDSYSTLFIGSGENVQKALQTLAKSESSCVAHEQPEVEQTNDGILFTACGNNAFLYAQLFLALEAPES